MKYVVEFNPHHGDPTQAEVEAETIHEAILAAWWRGAPEPEAIDGDKEPSYRAEDGGQPWQRVDISTRTTAVRSAAKRWRGASLAQHR
jgi:hypothetical protein